MFSCFFGKTGAGSLLSGHCTAGNPVFDHGKNILKTLSNLKKKKDDGQYHPIRYVTVTVAVTVMSPGSIGVGTAPPAESLTA